MRNLSLLNMLVILSFAISTVFVACRVDESERSTDGDDPTGAYLLDDTHQAPLSPGGEEENEHSTLDSAEHNAETSETYR